MSIWSIATEAAIWILIAGSLAVFGWFLVEVVRLARAPEDPAEPGGGGAEHGPDRDGAT